MADCRSYGMQGFVKDIAAIGLYDETVEKRIRKRYLPVPLRSCAPTSKQAARGASFSRWRSCSNPVSPKDLEREVVCRS